MPAAILSRGGRLFYIRDVLPLFLMPDQVGHECQYRIGQLGFRCTVGVIYALSRLQTGPLLHFLTISLPNGMRNSSY